MLQTPLHGRFQGENKRLVFAPPEWYFWLIYATGIAALLFGAHGVDLLRSDLPLLNNPPICKLTSALLVMAGIFAYVSLERMTVDLQERRYRRWFGKSFLPGYAAGRMDEFEAIVVEAQELIGRVGRQVGYRIVLVWKGMRLPVMVVEEVSVSLDPGYPLHAGAGATLARAASFASALGVPLVDRSMMSSPNPIKLV
jgi:hypothetical protein